MPGVPGSPGPVGLVQDTSGTGVRYLDHVIVFRVYFDNYVHLFRLPKQLNDIAKKTFVL
jgi:hypothetical protein